MGAILVARVFYYICYRYPLYCYWGFGDLSEGYPLSRKMGTAIRRRQQGARCRALTSRNSGSNTRLKRGGVAAPPGLSARRLAGFYRLPCADGAESHQ